MRIGLLLLAVASPGPAAEGEDGPTEVTGRVVRGDGKPAVGLRVANHCEQTGGEMAAFDAATTDGDGRFRLPVETYGRPFPLFAVDRDGTIGGVLTVEPGQAGRPVTITAGPLVRVVVTFTSDDPAYPVVEIGAEVQVGPDGRSFAESNTIRSYINLAGQEVATTPTGPVEFRLPPGTYEIRGRVPLGEISSHRRVARPLIVAPDPPGGVQAVGPIVMEVNPLVKRYGKAAPPLAIQDARGVPGGKGVTLADFRGKWILLDFWATWCGPCVGRGLPELFDLADEHAADRDRFVILAVHTRGSDSFADLDRKLASIVRETWHGRPMPFPILIDDARKTSLAYGIEQIPATVLIDPDGKVVEGGAAALRLALPPIPIARRIARALDRPITLDLGPDGAPLGATLEALGLDTRIEIKADPAALARVNLTPDSNVVLKLDGEVSLRTALDRLLTPLKLAAVPGPDGLIVTTPPQGRP